MAGLSTFIRENIDAIIAEWETFARTIPNAESMDIGGLRDHAKQMLAVIVRDLDTPQTNAEQEDKSRGKSDASEDAADTAAQEHGAGRADSGFSVEQMVSEFRALRASVIRLWAKKQTHAGAAELEDMTRFNESIDQAIAESITRYTHDITRSKERFLAILGHDLRTPLGSIITSTSFMLETHAARRDLIDPYLPLITRLSATAWRMNRMVSDLLDFARTSFGDTIPIVRGNMDVAKMVNDVAAEVRSTYPKSTITVETSVDLGGHWDCQRLAQALTNLLGNAVQHGARDSTITVRALATPTDVVISVSNNGPVIARADVNKIFEAARQGGGNGRADGHLGLGLYIVEKIVASHGGRMEVTSSAEEGTRFAMVLPRVAPLHEAPPLAAA